VTNQACRARDGKRLKEPSALKKQPAQKDFILTEAKPNDRNLGSRRTGAAI
jgi:hypothetical protein